MLCNKKLTAKNGRKNIYNSLYHLLPKTCKYKIIFEVRQVRQKRKSLKINATVSHLVIFLNEPGETIYEVQTVLELDKPTNYISYW